MTKPRLPRPSDENLWREAMRSVVPLRSRAARARTVSDNDGPERNSVKSAPAPAPASPAARAIPAAVLGTEKARHLPALAPLEPKVRRRLARGTRTIDARLDLHGLTQRQAYRDLLFILRRTQANGGSVVLVITGKGKGGEEGPGVLRRQVPLWLALPEFRELVIGFEDAHASQGGAGALYVRVRRATAGR